MKSTLKFLGIFAIVLALFSVGCASTGDGTYSTKGLEVWDDSIPDEECAVIYFSGYYPTAYNMIALKAKEPSGWTTFASDYRKIPAGETAFLGNIHSSYVDYRSRSEIKIRVKDVDFTYNFLPGKYYYVYIRPFAQDNKLHLALEIFDDLEKYMGYPWPKKDAEPLVSIQLGEVS